LSVSLCGQLIVFETISGLIYGHIVDNAMPQMIEIASVATIITGVLLGIRSFNNR
jgi:capsular polysaccharide biosynthesis protein